MKDKMGIFSIFIGVFAIAVILFFLSNTANYKYFSRIRDYVKGCPLVYRYQTVVVGRTIKQERRLGSRGPGDTVGLNTIQVEQSFKGKVNSLFVVESAGIPGDGIIYNDAHCCLHLQQRTLLFLDPLKGSENFIADWYPVASDETVVIDDRRIPLRVISQCVAI